MTTAVRMGGWRVSGKLPAASNVGSEDMDGMTATAARMGRETLLLV
jgi:hypothetical protein